MFIQISGRSKGVLSVGVFFQVLQIFSKDCQRKRSKWEWSVKVYNEIFLIKISLKVLLFMKQVPPDQSTLHSKSWHHRTREEIPNFNNPLNINMGQWSELLACPEFWILYRILDKSRHALKMSRNSGHFLRGSQKSQICDINVKIK